MSQQSVPSPSVTLTSFACPHCGAHATQNWYRPVLDPYAAKSPTPTIYTEKKLDDFKRYLDEEDEKHRKMLEDHVRFVEQAVTAKPFIKENIETVYGAKELVNVSISSCYTCKSLAIWLYDRLLYPAAMTAPSPNPDLSEDVLHDYEEA